MKYRLLLICVIALLLAVGLVVASCSGGGLYGNTTTTTGGAGTTAGTTAGAAGGAQVSLKNIAIDPTSVTIKAGESVTWTNNDGFAHRLVGDQGEFDSGDMAAGATFSFAFDTPGTVAYHCSIHPEMKGTITIQ